MQRTDVRRGYKISSDGGEQARSRYDDCSSGAISGPALIRSMV